MDETLLTTTVSRHPEQEGSERLQPNSENQIQAH